MKNYYQILNVKQTATDEEIKRSYRVLAKRYHPDVNPGDASAADRFADINEAHDVLSDRKSRAEYDAKLKESLAPKLKPSDVIARQRAQAQAAARQAAMRGNARTTTSAGAGTTAGTGAIFQNAQIQAQIVAIRNQAFQAGHDSGAAETRAQADREIARLNAQIQTLKNDNAALKHKLEAENAIKNRLADTEHDRRDLEQELFNRDRELAQEKLRAKDMETELQALRQSVQSKSRSRRTTVEFDSMHELLEEAQMRNRQLEQEKYQAELKNGAQIKLQQEKRKQLQDEIDELNRQVQMLTTEVEDLRAENEQWQQYAKSEEFLSDAERRLEDWSKKQKADRRLAKPTLYGALGVLIWATADEIDAAYNKLKKRYSGKTDAGILAKLGKINAAYQVLSDPDKRGEYNASIGFTEEQIETERRLIKENESVEEEYRSTLASKEFWAHYDELVAAALAGDVAAQNSLGEMYYYGDEIEQDLEQAVFWFKEAAKQKHADAMYNLGVCFINGEGVEKNGATGLGFVRQAAKLGSKPAKQFLEHK